MRKLYGEDILFIADVLSLLSTIAPMTHAHQTLKQSEFWSVGALIREQHRKIGVGPVLQD